VTDAGIMMVMRHCSQLRVLDLLGVVFFTGIYTFTDVLEEPAVSFFKVKMEAAHSYEM
jgi:hypothetical protein